ncbi:hypothetical protein BJF78_24995 [Pseudonocardia sp. CNS-139]|nr:hypothetical protein BJF78_24995 [Pseudonocardia sp. CNS-139]
MTNRPCSWRPITQTSASPAMRYEVTSMPTTLRRVRPRIVGPAVERGWRSGVTRGWTPDGSAAPAAPSPPPEPPLPASPPQPPWCPP